MYNILHLWWHFLETATSWGGLATSGIYCNVLITELYQKSWLQFFDDFAVKVNKKCNLIKRRWWLHAHFTKKSVGLLYYTVHGNMVSTLWLISDLFSQGIWWNKSEVLNNKSKITDHWKAGQKVNSVRHNVGLAWFDHSGCALQDYNYTNSFDLSELQTLRCKIKLRNLKGGCMYLCVNCFVRNCSRLGRGSMRGTCYTSGSLPCDGYPLLFSVTGICCAVFFLFKVRCVL